MTPPVFLLDALPGGPVDRLVIDGEEARHASRVRRLRTGEVIDVVDGRGRRARGTVTAVTRDAVSMTVEEIVDEPAPDRRIIAIQALAKGDRGERAVEVLTEVGVDVIVPWSAARSVAAWEGERIQRGLTRWRATAREAMKQSRRAWLPDVTAPVDLAGACAWIQGSSGAFLLDGAGEYLTELLGQDAGSGDLVIVVGPEGGIDAAETAAFEAAGARRASLGPTVLRTSTAGSIAVAIIASALRWPASPVTDHRSVTGSSS